MSGIDEQPLKNFPKCLECRTEEGYFWAGDNEEFTIYFDCVGYEGITESRVIRGYGDGRRRVTLEEVNSVTSIRCGYCTREVTEDLFNRILAIGRKVACRE